MDVRKELARGQEISLSLREISRLTAAGRIAQAKTKCQGLLAAHPQDAEINNLMGVIAITERHRSEALHYFQKAVSRAPNNVGYLNNLAKLFMKLERPELAIPVYMRIIKLDPKYATAIVEIAEFFQEMGRADKGLPYLENFLQQKPDHLNVRLMYAQSLETIGRNSEAEEIYRCLEKIPETRIAALARLSHVKKHSNSELFEQISKVMDEADASSDVIKTLSYSAGKVLEDLGDYDRAFEYYRRATESDVGGFDFDLQARRYEHLMELFTPDFFAERKSLGHASELPVLVVGMPRSGTTLTEQIIGRHPLAGGAGELSRLRGIARTLGLKRDFSGFHGPMRSMAPEQSVILAENYLQLLRFYAKDALRIVDKMPHNFEMLGFAATLFPNLRVIHSNRDAIDTCLSIYVNRFNQGHKYANDLSVLGRYYRQYARLMQHWKQVLPIRMYQSSYEELTDRPEEKTRELIDFLGLPWDDACLSPNDAKSTVMTLSIWQVRQPVYKSSVKRWRRFEKHLGPLIDALGDLADTA